MQENTSSALLILFMLKYTLLRDLSIPKYFLPFTTWRFASFSNFTASLTFFDLTKMVAKKSK